MGDLYAYMKFQAANSMAKIENAELKARATASASGLPALADDFGLEVAALGGAPGIHSARWGGPDKDFGLAMARVHDALEAKRVTDGHANFTCALALAAPDGDVQAFEGKVFGTLVWPPRGARVSDTIQSSCRTAMMRRSARREPGLKDAVSHRARAFEKLMLAAYDDDAVVRGAIPIASLSPVLGRASGEMSRSGCMCIGPSASPSVPIATSTLMSAMAAWTSALPFRLFVGADASRLARARAPRQQHLLRRRHAFVDGS